MPMQPYISEKFNGAIWRMEIDGLSKTLFIEVRNNNDKQVSFTAISLARGHVYFKNLTTPERWLTGIEAAYNGVLLLHNYQSGTGPAHRGIIAIDAITAKTLWTNYTYTVDYISVNGPVVYDTLIQPRKLYLADIKTGATTRINGPAVYKALQNHIAVPELITPAGLPAGVMPAVQAFENRVHYLGYNNFRIVSLHALSQGQLAQWLYVIDGTTNVYTDLLNTAIQKMQPEAFVLHQNCLIYVKNKSELKVLSL